MELTKEEKVKVLAAIERADRRPRRGPTGAKQYSGTAGREIADREDVTRNEDGAVGVVVSKFVGMNVRAYIVDIGGEYEYLHNDELTPVANP